MEDLQNTRDSLKSKKTHGFVDFHLKQSIDIAELCRVFTHDKLHILLVPDPHDSAGRGSGEVASLARVVSGLLPAPRLCWLKWGNQPLGVILIHLI